MKAKLLLFITLFSVIIVKGQEINFKQGTTSYASGATYNYVDTQVNGTTNITFTVENLSAPNLLISGATPRVEITGVDADQFVISGVLQATIANGSSDTFIIQFKPTTIGLKNAVMTIESNDADEATYTINLSANSIVNKQSTISLPSGPSYTYTATIPYLLYQSSDITSPATAHEIITFRINDANNTENLPTILTDLTLSISNSANIRRVALYDGLIELGEEDGGPSVVFSGLSLEAPAGSNKTFQVLVTFNETVTDNQNISIGITSATADPAGSNFAAANAGGAVSSTSTNVNKIIVDATALNFVEQPSNTDTFAPMDPAVTVEAVDTNGNRDLNYTTAVVLTSTGSYHTSGTVPLNDANNPSVAGLATFPLIIHNTLANNLVLTATSGTLDATISNLFNIEAASAANNYYRTAQSGKWSELTSWESSGNNISWAAATLVPTSASRSIIIRPLHIITCETTQDADQMTIQATGGLRILAGANFNINNGSGTDLIVQGLLEHAGGTFTQSASTAMSVSGTGTYLHSIPSATLTIPRFTTWSANSTCSITGLTNAVPITATNMDQNFSKLIWNNPNQSDFVNINSDTFKTSSSLTLGASANNKLCISSSGAHTNSIAAVTINGGTLTGFSGTASGTLTMSTLILNGGTFVGNSSNGATAINNTNAITINTNGHYIASNNSGSVTALVNAVTLNNNGRLTLINNAGSGNVTFNFAGTNRSLTLNSTSKLQLESVSSPGTAIINISNAFTCSSTALPAVDFGFGNVTGNLISLKGNFTKSGAGDITNSSATNAATGFVFSGVNQTFTFAGTSSGVNYTANNTGIFTCSSNFVFGTAGTQKTIFTINAPTVNLANRTFTGNATKAQFNIAAGVNVITTHANGLGGTSASGNFASFASIGNAAADGRVVFGANSNYTFSGSTVTPFPVGGTWVTPNNVIIGGNITSNYTTPFNLNGALNINAARTFKLNPAAGANLNLKGVCTVNGIFDPNNNENQITNAGGTPSLIVNGTFITKDPEGFTGVNATVPNIPITMGAVGTVNYAGVDQTISNFASYRNLTLSGSGTKTLGASIITVGNELNVSGNALLTIAENQTLSVADKITTVATTNTKGIIVENNGSLVQVNAPIDENVGDVRILRNTMPVFKNDYTYWSSPLTLTSAFSLNDLSPLTMFNKYLKFNHAANPQAYVVITNGAEDMVPGRGYLVRPPTTYNIEGSGPAIIYNATFLGVPNNGEVTHPITGSTTVDKFNLLGNPYPSALDAETFLTVNDAVLGGTLYFWTHNTANNAGNGYGYADDYATYNAGTGGVATTGGDGDANDNTNTPSGNIASGQSFFVKGIADGTGSVIFNNTMRISAAGINNQFFRQNQTETIEKNRVWLNLKGETQGFNQTLVGYITDATNALDKRFDSESFGGNQVTFYSMLDSKKLVIQGRALPFTTEDTVPLGYESTITGNLTISIDHMDGLFTNQDIYLKDNLLNVEHDLKATPYTFTTAIGTFNDRFVLKYVTQGTLSNPTFEQAIKGVTIFKNKNNIQIKSQYETIEQVYVYDLTGRLIFENKNINTNSFEIKDMNTAQQALVVKIILKNGAISTKKVL
jgi:hypothetical protein